MFYYVFISGNKCVQLSEINFPKDYISPVEQFPFWDNVMPPRRNRQAHFTDTSDLTERGDIVTIKLSFIIITIIT